VSLVADPNTGVAIYDSYGSGGWVQIGGTSASSPMWAGLVAIADQGRVAAGKASLDGYTQTLPMLYQLSSSDFHDVTTGNNGGFSAGAGFDLVTGRGSPVANLVAADLVGTTSNPPPSSNPPTVTTPTVVSQTATTATLSVTGTDPAGESTLRYTWTLTSGPGSVSFSANGTNAAKNTVATFTRAGSYVLKVTATDASNQSASSQVTVSLSQSLAAISVTPANASVAPGGSVQLSATALDQFGVAMATQPAFTWAVGTAGGTVSSTGLFTASATASGAVNVTATSGSVTGAVNVTITSAPPSGTVLFQDNFESGGGNWRVTSGYYDYYLVYDFGSYRLWVSNGGTTTSRAVAGSSSWSNYSYQATLNIDVSSTGSASLLARVQDNTHLYFFGYNVALGEWMIAKRYGSTVTILATSAPYAFSFDTDYTVRADLNGSSLKLFVNGVLQVSTTDSTFATGKIGFTATNATAELDNVVVTQLSGTQVVRQVVAQPAPAAQADTPPRPFQAWRRWLSDLLLGWMTGQ